MIAVKRSGVAKLVGVDCRLQQSEVKRSWSQLIAAERSEVELITVDCRLQRSEAKWS